MYVYMYVCMHEQIHLCSHTSNLLYIYNYVMNITVLSSLPSWLGVFSRWTGEQNTKRNGMVNVHSYR